MQWFYVSILSLCAVCVHTTTNTKFVCWGFCSQMDDIDAMFSDLLGEMDLLTQVSQVSLTLFNTITLYYNSNLKGINRHLLAKTKCFIGQDRKQDQNPLFRERNLEKDISGKANSSRSVTGAREIKK